MRRSGADSGEDICKNTPKQQNKKEEREYFILFTDFINTLSDLLYSYILIILLLGTGIYFSIRTRFVQFRLFLESIRVVTQPGSAENGLPTFQALMVSTASRVGTAKSAGRAPAL